MENKYRIDTQKGKILQALINGINNRVSVHDISVNIKPKILNHTARIEEIRKNLPAGYIILNYTRINKQIGQKFSRYCLTVSSQAEDQLDKIKKMSDFLLFQKK